MLDVGKKYSLKKGHEVKEIEQLDDSFNANE